MILSKNHSDLTISSVVFFSAAIWGLYWLPLRKIEEAGIAASWSVLAIYVVPFLFLLPWVAIRRRALWNNARSILLIGLPIGAGLAFYAMGFLHTTVLRTTLLFYMTPIWSTLLAMFFLGEKTGLRRWVAIGIGLAGLCLMLLGKDNGSAQTAINRGDISALLAGIFWSAGTVLIRKKPELDSFDVIPAQYLFAIAFSAIFVWAGMPGDSASESNAAIPALSAWLNALPWLVGFYVVIFLPSLYACIRGAQLLSPGRVGILMMSEVLVAGISAPLLAGELISMLEWIATAMIVLAATLEITTPESTPETV